VCFFFSFLFFWRRILCPLVTITIFSFILFFSSHFFLLLLLLLLLLLFYPFIKKKVYMSALCCCLFLLLIEKKRNDITYRGNSFFYIRNHLHACDQVLKCIESCLFFIFKCSYDERIRLSSRNRFFFLFQCILKTIKLSIEYILIRKKVGHKKWIFILNQESIIIITC